MITKSVAALREDYEAISKLARETEDPIYITEDGKEDMVIMSMGGLEKREQLIKLKLKLEAAEKERLSGAKGYSVEEVRQMLEEKYNEKKN